MTSFPPVPAGGRGSVAVADVVSMGIVVHVQHPDFGGWLTAGYAQRADGSRLLEVIAHGCSVDVGCDGFTSCSDLGRYVERQVGNRASYWAARAALEKAS